MWQYGPGCPFYDLANAIWSRFLTVTNYGGCSILDMCMHSEPDGDL